MVSGGHGIAVQLLVDVSQGIRPKNSWLARAEQI
jgi:hypothetical protein